MESATHAPIAPDGLPGFGLAAAAAGLLLVLLAVGERAGLSGTAAWPIGFTLVATGALVAVAMVRTAAEQPFLGRERLLSPAAGGVLLGALVAAGCHHLLRPTSSRELVATALGAAAGLLLAHVTARRRAGSMLLIGEAVRGEEGAPSLIQGLLVFGVGMLLAGAALPAARDAVALLTGWGAAPSTFAVAAVPALAVAAGGLRGLLALAAALAAILAAGLALTLWLGVLQLGAPPLPGLAQDEVLLGIASVRTRLFQADTLPFIVTWIPREGLTGILTSQAFLAAAAVAAIAGRALSPGVAIGRGAALGAGVMAQALVLLGLAAMAGYAVEAAGLQFVGASLQTPPPGLLEASRQGLADFCGARPETLDQLRAACGLAPRQQGQLALDRIRLAEPFLWTGTPVALGVPAALAVPARLGPAAFPGLAVALGLWLAAQGLGRGVLGRGRIAPGLASLRLGLVRLAAMGSAAGVSALLLLAPGSATWWPPLVLLALLALGLDAIQQGFRPPPPAAGDPAVQRAAMSRRTAAPRSTAQSA